jgi:hypothetical protein
MGIGDIVSFGSLHIQEMGIGLGGLFKNGLRTCPWCMGGIAFYTNYYCLLYSCVTLGVVDFFPSRRRFARDGGEACGWICYCMIEA